MYKSLPLEVQPLTPLALYTIFHTQKKYPFRKTSTDKWSIESLLTAVIASPFLNTFINEPGSFHVSFTSIKCIYVLILLQTEMVDMIFLTLS